MEEKKDLLSLDKEELGALLESIGEPRYRAAQLFSQLHAGRLPEEITNIGKKTWEKLFAVATHFLPRVRKKLVSALDGTVKYLFELQDGNCVESVLMQYEHGITICISSQVGCAMGCKFCASTIGGRVRNLTVAELLGQVIAAARDSGQRIGGIVMMGIGEPLDNFDNVVKFLQLVNHAEGQNIGYRHISLSTCGLVPQIDRLATLSLPITLSISLHAADDETRSAIMPVNRRYPIAELLNACRRYYKETSRRISFEYAMIDGVNDSVEHAKELIHRLKGLPAHFNLIPLNHVEESPLKPSSKNAVSRFQKTLEDAGITATVRRTLGSDIDASCGQLRRKYTKEQEHA